MRISTCFKLFCFAYCFFVPLANDASPQDSQSEGRVLADSFILMKDASLDSFLMVANLSVHSDPESPELLSTSGEMRYLDKDREVFTSVSWKPTPMRGFNRVHVFNAQTDRIDGVLNGKSFAIHNSNLVDNRIQNVVPEAESIDASVLHPFAFPIASYNSFTGRLNGFNPLTIFKNWACKKIVKKNGRVYTYWVRPGDPSNSYNLFVFDDNKIVLREWMFSQDHHAVSEIGDLNAGYKRVASVETKWGRFGDVDVPVESHMVVNNGDFKQDFFIDCEMSYFDENSSEFSEAVSYRDKTKAKVLRELGKKK